MIKYGSRSRFADYLSGRLQVESHMRIVGGHVFQCVIGRFVASIFLLGIEVGGAADEIICCPIDSELAIVKYGRP